MPSSLSRLAPAAGGGCWLGCLRLMVAAAGPGPGPAPGPFPGPAGAGASHPGQVGEGPVSKEQARPVICLSVCQFHGGCPNPASYIAEPTISLGALRQAGVPSHPNISVSTLVQAHIWDAWGSLPPGVLALHPGCVRGEEPQTRPIGLGASQAAPAQRCPGHQKGRGLERAPAPAWEGGPGPLRWLQGPWGRGLAGLGGSESSCGRGGGQWMGSGSGSERAKRREFPSEAAQLRLSWVLRRDPQVPGGQRGGQDWGDTGL